MVAEISYSTRNDISDRPAVCRDTSKHRASRFASGKAGSNASAGIVLFRANPQKSRNKPGAQQPKMLVAVLLSDQ